MYRVYFGQVMFDNGLVALDLLGWLGFRWLMKLTGVILISDWNHGGEARKSVHTESIHADVVTGETVELRKIAGMKGPKVEEVLHALPH